MLTISNGLHELENPALFTPGAELWNDSHIALQMLKAHLSPETDAASYKPETIKRICNFLPQAMGLKNGAKIVDLGCGPGLYASEFSQMGHTVTGIDRSNSSIAYARKQNAGQQAVFINDSYLKPFGENCFHAAVMISKDYGVLSPDHRKILLKNIHASLKPDGFFALDVHSLNDLKRLQENATRSWESADSGFWRPHPYIALSKKCFYPEASVACDLHAVLDDEFTVYRIWQTYFSPESIKKEIQASGFMVRAIWSNLMGDPLNDDSLVLGILCQKN